jgi:membrane associated rhomboid family serine protease
MFIPIRTDCPLRRTPWVNYALILVNILVFLAQLTDLHNPNGWFRFLELNPAEPHLYQYFTYAFLHAGFLHIIGNMLFLYIFGNNVNDKMGNGGYLAFYLAGGVFAGIGYVLTGLVPVLGASGAIAAVTGAYLVLFPRSYVTVLFIFFIIGTYDVPSLWFVLFFFLSDVVYNFLGAEMGDTTAHVAHISGTIFGFAICLILLAMNYLPRDHFDIMALIQRWNRRRTYRDMVSGGYDPFSVIPKGAAVDPNMERIQDLRGSIAEAITHGNIQQASQLYLQLKQIDPQQVLSRQAQIEIGNHLASQGLYKEAAEAYELLLKHYQKSEQAEQVELMLGLIYARYLNDPFKAKSYLTAVLPRLRTSREVELAQEELGRLPAV